MSTAIVAGTLSVIAAVITLIAAIIQLNTAKRKKELKTQTLYESYRGGNSMAAISYSNLDRAPFKIGWPELVGGAFGIGIGLGIADMMGGFGPPGTLNAAIDSAFLHLSAVR